MRLGYDLRIMRYPPGGTAVYARIAMERMAGARPEGWEVVALEGWPRLGQGRRIPASVRRISNLALDAGWLGWGAQFEAGHHRLTAWFTPASLLPFALPRPAVAIVHNLAFLIVPELFDTGYRAVAERLHRQSITRASRIITPSEFLRGIIIERLDAPPAKVRVIPWGMDHLPPPAENAGIAIPRPYALFVGQTQPHWNVGLLLDAWQAGVPNELSLVIAGPAGRDDDNLRRRVARERLAGRVVFAGTLAAPRLLALIRDASLFVDPSLAEGFAKPALEAMMQGVPSAVATTGALTEVTQGAALTFDPRDVQGLAGIVTRLHHDVELRDRLRRAGADVARQYVWARAVIGYWEEVRSAVTEERG